MNVDYIIQLASIFLAILIVLPVHEFAHAFVAVKCGDMTPKVYGRLTLNPMAHFDVAGLIAIIFFRFGWGKPVPVNPNNFKHRKLGCVLVSIAGVVSNYILAFIFVPIIYLFTSVLNIPNIGYFDDLIIKTLVFVPQISLCLFVFNLLPIYPLDGFKLFETLNGGRGKVYNFLRSYGQYILIGLILLGLLADMTGVYYLDILGLFIRWATNVVGYPIYAFWGLIF